MKSDLPLNKPKATLKNIAEASGVSVATVSFVLSGKGNISKVMSDKVKSIASELGYVRPGKGRSGQVQKKTLAILTYINKEWAYAWNIITPIVNAIEQNNTARDYATVIIPVQDSSENSKIYQSITDAGVCAVYSIHVANATLFQSLEEANIPVLVINSNELNNTVCTVCSDDFEGAYEGTKFLISRGHEHILYIDYFREGQNTVISDRFIGFKKAIQESFQREPVNHITTDLFNVEMLKRELMLHLHKTVKPTAIFAHDDRLAEIIIKLIHNEGLNIPEDISIIAPGDVLDYSNPMTPQITTMSIQTTVLGNISTEKMFNLMDKPAEDIHGLKVSQKLVDRGSVRDIS